MTTFQNHFTRRSTFDERKASNLPAAAWLNELAAQIEVDTQGVDSQTRIMVLAGRLKMMARRCRAIAEMLEDKP